MKFKFCFKILIQRIAASTFGGRRYIFLVYKLVVVIFIDLSIIRFVFSHIISEFNTGGMKKLLPSVKSKYIFLLTKSTSQKVLTSVQEIS
jgi:hypothetical protein